MAIDFPDSPTDGQEFQGYYWDDSKQAWRSQSTNRGSVITSATTPTGATAGDLWFNTVDGTMYVYYDDGITTQWVEIQANVDNYKTPSQNYIINGGFDIWQRGTSTTNNTSYLADRWYVTANTSGNQCSQSRVAANLPGKSGYALRVQQTSSVTVVEYAARQFIEAQNIFTLAGKTTTVSFWYRSNKTGTHSVRLTASGRATGATDSNLGFTVLEANTWARYFLTFTTFANATAWTVADNDWGAALDIGFRTGNSVGHTTLSANDYFEITGVQLEEGAVATPFRRNANSIEGELSACARYFYRLSATSQFTPLAFGYQITTTEVTAYFFPITPMRITPTASVVGMEWSDNAAFNIGISNFTTQLSTSTPRSVRMTANISANGAQFRPGTFRTTNSGLCYIDFNAEL